MEYKDLPRPIKDAFKKAGIKLSQYCEGQTKYFRVIIYENLEIASKLLPGAKRWLIYFGDKKTFSKWGNSRNFKTEIWYTPKKNQCYPVGDNKGKRRKQYTIPNLTKELAWCKKVNDTGLFHWNTYFSTIETPWFIHN